MSKIINLVKRLDEVRLQKQLQKFPRILTEEEIETLRRIEESIIRMKEVIEELRYD